jgi:hypothetical protein
MRRAASEANGPGAGLRQASLRRGFCRLPAARSGVHPAAVITLHTMPGTDKVESMSPFCMKVEVYLKLQKVPYQVKLGDPRKAPKGKLPLFEAEDGRRIADSSAILAYVEERADKPLDRALAARGSRRSSRRPCAAPSSTPSTSSRAARS